MKDQIWKHEKRLKTLELWLRFTSLFRELRAKKTIHYTLLQWRKIYWSPYKVHEDTYHAVNRAKNSISAHFSDAFCNYGGHLPPRDFVTQWKSLDVHITSTLISTWNSTRYWFGILFSIVLISNIYFHHILRSICNILTFDLDVDLESCSPITNSALIHESWQTCLRRRWAYYRSVEIASLSSRELIASISGVLLDACLGWVCWIYRRY